MGFWDKLKRAFGGKPAVPRRPSGRTWRLTKRDGTLALVAPHGVFPVAGIADDLRGVIAALADGGELVCEGDYVGGSTISELVVTRIVSLAPARGAPPAATAPPPGTPPPPVMSDADRWRADELLGLSGEELRRRALRIDPYRTAWIGRVDTIPPQSDERTALIDRGLMLRGFLTRAQLDEIHRIGDQWLLYHEAIKLAESAARAVANTAVAEERARKAARKAALRQAAAERAAARIAAVAARRATDIIYAGRGVSARLGDRRAHVEELTRLGLPVLATPGDLARALDLPIPVLRWLCFHSEAARQPHYAYFEIAKRSGGVRLLASPRKKLAAAQRWVLERVLAPLEVTPYAHGFVAGRSTVTNARPHLGQAIVVNLDLENFFGTITFARIRGLFESLGYSPAVATLLALLVSEAPRVKVELDGEAAWVAVGDRALPQGACTSPAISNLVARKLDRRLAGAAGKLGWTYTRYADDLTLSSPDPARLALILARVRAIVRAEGFTINEAKGRVQRAARRQQVTGIIVNDQLGVPREQLRRLRAILHGARTTGLAAQNREQRPDFEAWLRGTIAYVAMIDPAKGARLRAELDALSPGRA